MLSLVALDYRLRSDQPNTLEWLAWHLGWYVLHKEGAATMRRTVIGDHERNLSIAAACRKAAADNLRSARRVIKARGALAKARGE